jgi:hypothetical protein
LPTAAIVAAAWALAWAEHGSVDAADWLPYAVFAGLLLGVVLLAGARAPTRFQLWPLAALVALAGWQAISLTWSPSPALARDEALLTALYAVAFAVPALTLRGVEDRLVVVAAVAAGTAALAIAAAFRLRLGSSPADLFNDGRLSFPINYPNGQAACFLVGFWPAIVLAARRPLTPVVRGLALGAAVAVLGGWLLTQSKGGAVALVLSAVVLFAFVPGRLRFLVPTLIAAAFVAAAVRPLTAPFRARDEPTLGDAIRHAGTTLIWLALAAAALGIVYAFVDRRVSVPEARRRLAGAIALAALAVAVIASVVAFFVAEAHPGRFAEQKWRSFKHLPTHESGTTHLLTLGSNRYDFWRVALDEFADHPLAGIGGRGFGVAYLQHRRSAETPARSHSLELDTLSEEGLVGFALLVAAVAPLLALALARARRGDLGAAAAFAASVYAVVHATGDWTWTFPAVGVPLFVLLGAATSSDDGPALRRRAAVPAAALAFALALFAFAPPWLSARFTAQALEGSAAPARDLHWARRLDPLATDPLVAQSVLARTAAGRTRPLERAVRKEPRSAALRYLLGTAYADAGRRALAKRELRAARRLDPGDVLIAAALRRLRGS